MSVPVCSRYSQIEGDVLTDRSNLVRLHWRWLVGFVIALGIAVGAYGSAARSAQRWPGGSSAIGLVLGILSGLIILFEFALWLRKTRLFRTRRLLGNAQLWMKAHIWLGLFVAPLAWMHSGFSFGGSFTTVLMWLLLIVIASGLFGLWMQNIVPRRMLEQLRTETVFSQIERVQRQYADEAARIVSLSCGDSVERSPLRLSRSADLDSADNSGGTTQVVGAPRRIGALLAKSAEGSAESLRLANPQPLWQAYQQVVRPYLESRRAAAGPLSTLRRSNEYFALLRTTAGDGAQGTVSALEELCDKCRDLHLQRRLHFLLHSWLVVHLPLSISLVILLAIHVVYALRFG